MAGTLVMVQTRIPRDLHRAAQALARKDHRTLASFVLVCIEREVKGLRKGSDSPAQKPRHRRGGR